MMRQAQRALFDLRRGLPVMIEAPQGASLVLAVESLDARTLAETRILAGGRPRLVLSRHRMEALGSPIDDDAAAFVLATDVDFLQLNEWASMPGAALPASLYRSVAGAAETVALRMLARTQYMPAAVACPVQAGRRRAVDAEIAAGNLLAVSLADAEHFCDSIGGRLSRVSEARIPLAESEQSRFVLFREGDGLREHVAILIGERAEWTDPVPVRLHSACLTGDLFGSLRCDCGDQLRRGVAAIAAQGGGVLLYLSQEGRGIGLANKLRAYTLQDGGLDTVDADRMIGFGDDERDFRIAREMLAQLDVRRVKLLTNNPGKIDALEQAGIQVAARQSLFGDLTEQNRRYLLAKAQRHGHRLDELLDATQA